MSIAVRDLRHLSCRSSAQDFIDQRHQNDEVRLICIKENLFVSLPLLALNICTAVGTVKWMSSNNDFFAGLLTK